MPVDFALRSYQKRAVARMLGNLKRGKTRSLFVLPAGTGKTRTIIEIVKRLHKPGHPVLIICHTDYLMKQMESDFQRVMEALDMTLKVGVEQAERYADADCDVIIGSLNSLNREGCTRLQWLADVGPSVILYDEGHHSPSVGAKRLLIRFGVNEGKVPLIGCTATPVRLDGKPLLGTDGIFQGPAYVYPIEKALKDGWLCDPVGYRFVTDVDISGVKANNGDFNAEQLSHAVNVPFRTERAIEHWKEVAGDRQTVVFCADIAHAKDAAEAWRKAGVNAEAIWDGCSAAERERIIVEWKAGIIQVVCNVQILTEGFDYPELSCVVMLRPTKSLALYIQMVGRILRIFDGKADAIVIDMVDNCNSHDLISLPNIVDLPATDDEGNPWDIPVTYKKVVDESKDERADDDDSETGDSPVEDDDDETPTGSPVGEPVEAPPSAPVKVPVQAPVTVAPPAERGGESPDVPDVDPPTHKGVSLRGLLSYLEEVDLIKPARERFFSPRSNDYADFFIGAKFGTLTMISNPYSQRQWGRKSTVADFLCECGEQITRKLSQIIHSKKSGHIPMCGTQHASQMFLADPKNLQIFADSGFAIIGQPFLKRSCYNIVIECEKCKKLRETRLTGIKQRSRIFCEQCHPEITVGVMRGNWKVIEPATHFYKNINGQSGTSSAWLCECQCRNKTRRVKDNIRLRSFGETAGCRKCASSKNAERLISHGESKLPIYQKWRGAKNHSGLAPEWDKYESFREWAMNTTHDFTQRLKRVDKSKPFGPDNCVWVPHKSKSNAATQDSGK